MSKMTLAGSAVLVIWEWEWFSEELESNSDERTEITVRPETPPHRTRERFQTMKMMLFQKH